MTTPTLLVLNPNCTGWMTERVVQQVQRRLSCRAVVDALTVADGPPVIDDAASFDAGAAAAQRALADRLATRPTTGGVLLACFGDPGLEALRAAAAPRPVHGLAEAAMRLATTRGLRYAVLTCGPAWVGLLTRRAHDFGLAAGLSGIHALPVNGRALAEEPARWQGALQAAADQAAREGAQALILGGAAFAGLGGLIDSPLPVIDAIDAATDALLRHGAPGWRTAP
jgi:allantoin racemase